MIHVLLVVLAMATFIGHFALAVWLFNRLHAKPWSRRLIGGLEKALLLTAAVVLAAYSWRYISSPVLVWEYPLTAIAWPWQAYAWFCRALCVLAIPLWLWPKLTFRTPAALVEQSNRCIDIAGQLGYRPVAPGRAAVAARIPGNEIFRLQVARKTLALPALPAELEGLMIAHLSDLHMTGKLTREFYEAVVDQTNALQPDLIAITGDIAETEACIAWVEPILGRLRARLGSYFVLGNHEQRLADVAPLREALRRAGIVDLGSRCQTLDVGGNRILLAGTEMPWFGRRPDVTGFVTHGEAPDFRLLLSHTPDEYAWARAQGFDLMLAGHNHGGQIRLPYLGALITPSRFGCRYAGGLYLEEPTVLHVSRGIAGLHSVRFNCPPELPLLTLTRSASVDESLEDGAAQSASATRSGRPETSGR